MLKLIKRLFFAWRYKHAVKKAVEFQKLTGRKHFVLEVGGKLRVVAKKDIKIMVATRKFKKGVKVADIEKRALFITK